MAAIVGLVVALSAGSAQATTLPQESPWERLQRADLVVEGDVVDSTYAMAGPEGDQIPVTVLTMTVDRVLAGDAADMVRVMIPGGPWGGDRWHVVLGTPTLRVGDHVLLALRPNTRNTMRVVGWFHGAFVRAASEAGDTTRTGDQRSLLAWDCYSRAPAVVADDAPVRDPSVDTTEPEPVTAASDAAVPWDEFVRQFDECLHTSAAGGAR